MEKKNRRKFSADFKAKVVLEALKERSTIEELARKYEFIPTRFTSGRKSF
jgi:transposase